MADPAPADMTLGEALRAVTPVRGRIVAAAPALGLVPARDVEAPADVPAHASAAHAGFALRAVDARIDLPAFFEPAEGDVQPGTAARVGAGDPLPHGADAVVAAEEIPLPGHIELIRPVAPGDGVVHPGAELRAGDVLVPAGHALGAVELERLARAGVTEVPVAAPPRVGVVGGLDGVAPIVRAAGGDPVARDDLDHALDRDDVVVVAGRPPGEQLWAGRDVALADCDGIPVVGVTGEPAAALPVLAGLLRAA